MTTRLDRDDIQGNVLRAYGRYSSPCARYFFLHIDEAKAGRKFVDRLRERVTATPWTTETKPLVTLNVAFTFMGLLTLGLPTRTLKSMPAEFVDGMKARAHVLGDLDNSTVAAIRENWCSNWDPIWKANRAETGEDVHLWVSMNARVTKGTDEPVEALEAQTEWLRQLCRDCDSKVRILTTNGKHGDEEFQAATAIFQTLPDGTKIPTRKEHFGFTDGIGDPVYEGQYSDAAVGQSVVGRGKWMAPETGWEPLATGEFILGHPDESQELPPTASPSAFMLNGTFLVYRKLHENVASFREVVADEAATYAAMIGVSQKEAQATLEAKMVGRWADGVPLSKVPTYDEWEAFKMAKGFSDPDPLKSALAYDQYFKSSEASNFRYADDMMGFKCPATSHLRRMNTRDYLDPTNTPTGDNPNATTQLNKRRRILRRGLPYGPSELGNGSDETEQGVAFMVICANIFRPYQFVQQQWIQYGLDFNAGNNTCPLLGNHTLHKRHVIPSDPRSGKPPFVMSKLKAFVEIRGGDYFFIPSMSALRMMAMGIVDST